MPRVLIDALVSESTGESYRKLYAYGKYLDVLNEDAG